MINEIRLTSFGAPRYDVEACIAALLYWKPGMWVSELSPEVERQLNYASPETKKRYRRAIIGTLIPNDGARTTEANSLAFFVKAVEKRKARLEAIFYRILTQNETLRKICLYLGNEFETIPLNRSTIRQWLSNELSSRKGAYETAKKSFAILRDFGLLQSQPEERLLWRFPEVGSFAYILYDHYLSIGVIAPNVSEILQNEYVRASFFHSTGILEALRRREGVWWNHEKRPPLDRIIFRFGSVDEFLSSLTNAQTSKDSQQTPT